MRLYCLVTKYHEHAQEAYRVSYAIYEGNPKWPACSIGEIRRAYSVEVDDGHAEWIAFDRQSRPFSGETPEAALEAFADRPSWQPCHRPEPL